MIEAQIIYGKLEAISRQMGETLQRISRSTLVAEDRQFATALVTGELQIAVQHQYEPEHLFAIKESVSQLFEYFSYDIAEGDVLLVADPYSGGTRGQTMTMVAPIFYKGEIVLFPVVRVQMKDLAGEIPGGVHPEAFEVWQESMRISPIKLYKEGKLQRDVLRFLLANSRIPSQYESELRAMHAVLQFAGENIISLLKLYGEKVQTSVYEMINYTQRRVGDYINQLPDGEMKSTVSFAENGKTLSIHAAISKSKNNEIIIDFSGTDSQVQAPINSSLVSTKAFAVWPFLASFEDELTINDGVLELFFVKAEEGSLLNPKFPAATGLSSMITGHFISESITKALRSHQVPRELSPVIDGPGPQVVLYPPIGKSAEIDPIFLIPGYPEAKESWGPSGLFGNRQLVSAEELEFSHNFKIVKRELDKDNRMSIRISNYGADFYMTVIVPENNEHLYGSVILYSEGKIDRFSKSTSGRLFKSGDELEFVYMRRKGAETDA